MENATKMPRVVMIRMMGICCEAAMAMMKLEIAMKNAMTVACFCF